MSLARIKELPAADPDQFAAAAAEIDRTLQERIEELRHTRERVAQLRTGDRLFVPAHVPVPGLAAPDGTHRPVNGSLGAASRPPAAPAVRLLLAPLYLATLLLVGLLPKHAQQIHG